MSDPAPDWLGYTDAQITSEAIATGERNAGLSDLASVGLMRTLWETAAMLMIRLFQVAVRPMVRHADPRRARGWYLRLHGLSAGVPWRTARACKGTVVVGSVTGGTLPAGASVVAAGLTFSTDVELILPANGSAGVEVTCTTAGAAGNLAAGTEARWESPAVADATAALEANWIKRFGYDTDTDDTYRPRVLEAMQIKGVQNTAPRYRLSALGVPRVSSVAVGRTPRGYGSMDLSVLVANRLPTTDDLALVRLALDDDGLICRDLWVRAPVVVDVDVTAVITGTATTAAVEQAIDRWWRTNIGIGDGVLVQDLYRGATIGIDGLESVDFDAPLANLPASVSTWYRPQITVT